MIIFFLKLRLVSDLTQGKSNFTLILKYKGVSDLSPTMGKIGHRWFLKKIWYFW